MTYTPRVLLWLRRTVAAEWQGPADLPRSLTIEWRLIACRWVGMLAVGPALLLMHLPIERLVGAYVILLFGAAYNVTVRWYLQRQPALFANGYLTTAADTLLNISMVLVGGGFDTPLSNVLFTGTISVAGASEEGGRVMAGWAAALSPINSGKRDDPTKCAVLSPIDAAPGRLDAGKNDGQRRREALIAERVPARGTHRLRQEQ